MRKKRRVMELSPASRLRPLGSCPGTSFAGSFGWEKIYCTSFKHFLSWSSLLLLLPRTVFPSLSPWRISVPRILSNGSSGCRILQFWPLSWRAMKRLRVKLYISILIYSWICFSIPPKGDRKEAEEQITPCYALGELALA